MYVNMWGSVYYINTMFISQSQLGPLNDELKLVNNHFEKFIGMKKRELEDRRKNNSLAKFLSERVSSEFSLEKPQIT